jgi:hypothetical protein
VTAALWVLGCIAAAFVAEVGLGFAIGRYLARCQPAPLPNDCEYCGYPLPSNRITYCTRYCRMRDDDHGPNGDDQ